MVIQRIATDITTCYEQYRTSVTMIDLVIRLPKPASDLTSQQVWEQAEWKHPNMWTEWTQPRYSYRYIFSVQ